MIGNCGKISSWCEPDFEDDLCLGCPINILADERMEQENEEDRKLNTLGEM